MRSTPRLSIVLLLSLVMATLVTGQPAKSKSKTKKSATSESAAAPAKAIAVHPFRVDGVDVALLEVTRTAPEVVTVKWEYRNKNAKPAELAADSKGWSDPYRLSWDAYLLLPDGKTKVPVMKDSDGRPVAGAVGRPNQLTISALPRKPLGTWAKYPVPAGTPSVTIAIVGADPFESVPISEPGK
jgi:hypothetical protein